MSLNAKIALGAILGSGVVAVGGHEIYSAATGKSGIFVSQTDSYKIRKLLDGWKGKCTLKIKEETNQNWEEIEDKTSLEKLFKALEEFSKNNCQNQTKQEKIVIFKKDANSGEWFEIAKEISNKFNDVLLKYFQNDEDIIFTLERKNGNRWEELSSDYLTFSNENDEIKEIKVSLSTINEDKDLTNDETKNYKFTGGNRDDSFNKIKKEFPEGFSNWTCIIKFEKIGTNLTQLKNKDKLMNSSNSYGFFDKLKIDTNEGRIITEEKEKIKVKELKKRFIASCGQGEKAIQENETTIMHTKTFKLTSDSKENKLTFSSTQEFESWFEEIELTEKENKWADNSKDWNISFINENSAGHKILELKGEDKILSCFIRIGETGNDFETKLREKINKDSNKANNRKKFLKKCRNNANRLFMYIGNGKADEKISTLLNVE